MPAMIRYLDHWATAAFRMAAGREIRNEAHGYRFSVYDTYEFEMANSRDGRGSLVDMSSSPVPLKSRHVKGLIHVKFVEAVSLPVAVVWKFGDGIASSDIIHGK
ncbi:hypothetical protein TNCV_1849211 [Trichonephila clavipes]|nr:hypothetical protein TNCV_1849211 [Trichonephila clavipes]